MTRKVDIAIVGAGAAGLAAAHAARAAGLRVLVLEAKDRIGGRGYTETASLGVPFDHGCFWLHAARINPFARIADSLGFTYRRAVRRQSRRIFMGKRWATAAEQRAWRRFDVRSFAAIHAAGGAGRDEAATAYIDRDSRWAPLFDAWTAALSGVTPEACSTLDLARYRDAPDNWPVREGFGALIAAYGAGLPVRRSCPVSRIAWNGSGVRLATPDGELEATAAVITVSTAVLASARLAFSPALPRWKRDAVAAVPLGMANKIAFAFDRDVFGLGVNASVHMLAETAATIGFQIRPFGWNVAVGHVGGAFSAEIERAGSDAMSDFALDRLAEMFGGSIRRRVTASVATRWASDPWIGGGYSAALPGHAEARAALARPLAGRVFFAGEAVSIPYYSTAHGAWFTGTEAARQAVAVVKGA